MIRKVLIGTDLLISYILNIDYIEGITILFRWIQRIGARKYIDMGSILILTHFSTISKFKRLSDFDVIETIPRLSPTLKSLSMRAVSAGEDIRALLMQVNLLEHGYADILVTENRATQELSKARGYDDRVFTIEEFVEMCVTDHRELDEMRGVGLQMVRFGTLSLKDPFFKTFINEYAPYYYTWFERKADDLVYVAKDAKGGLHALLKLKEEIVEEKENDITPSLPIGKYLKISSLKVDYTGQKLGERFLRIIFDQAVKSRVDYIYYTIYGNSIQRKRLIGMLSKWGFRLWGTKNTGEQVYIRLFRRELSSDPILQYPFQNWRSNVYLIAIERNFADLLVPPTEVRNQFYDIEPFKNAIRKLLILESRNMTVKTGDCLMFYRKGRTDAMSFITAVGVIDGVFTSFLNEEHFIRRCQKRSVLPHEALHEYWERYEGKPIVVDFLHSYSFKIGEIDRSKMILTGVEFNKLMSNMFVKLSENQVRALLKDTEYEKNFIIN